MRIDRLSNKYKFLIIMFVVIPLFIFIFYDMQNNKEQTSDLIYKCNKDIIILNESMEFYCDNYLIKYNHNTREVIKISISENKFNKQIKNIVNKSLFDFPS